MAHEKALKPGFQMPTIPEDERERKDIVSKANKKLGYARRYYQRWHERWVRYYKIWRSLLEKVDSTEDQDEPDSFIPYVFGMIEDMASRITEPGFKLKPPARVKPKKPGQQGAADNFSTMVRAYFTNADYQAGYVGSIKEGQITGTRWEYDVFENQWREGMRWQKRKLPKMVEAAVELAGKVFPTMTQALVTKWLLVPDRHPTSVGYKCRFPSTFHVHPQPGVKFDEFHSKAKWTILEEPNISIEELQKEKFQDPTTGEVKSVYDLEQLIKESKGSDEKKVIVPQTNIEGADYFELALAAVSGNSSSSVNRGDEVDEGIDKIHVYHIFYNDGRVESIGQGKYLIRVAQLPIAAIPLRPIPYTIDPQFLHAIGMIEPIEDMVYELNDVHNLSMANWMRIINRMLVVDMSKIVSKDDLQPRPGQVIRTNGNVNDVVATFSAQDPSGSMLTMESNVKGLMERAIAAPDFSPGIGGTKQSHSTLGGLEEISQNVNIRISTIIRYNNSAKIKQMHVMEKYTSFYLFTPMPFEKFDDDGSTMTVELSNEDIYTDGEGFYFTIEQDPSFGNDVIRRDQLFLYLKGMYEYDQWVREFGTQDNPRPDIPNIIKMISTNFGFDDTSVVLKRPDGVLDPKKELEIFMAGGEVEVNPKEPLMKHYMRHLADLNAKAFKEAVESGKIKPDVVDKFQKHITRTKEVIDAVMGNPVEASEKIVGGANV